jgi:hypothetical protein
VNRKQLRRAMFPTDHRETWREYVWYCLLFGTVGSGVLGVAIRSRFFLDVFGVGIGIMGMLLVGWLLYVILRFLMHHLSGGVS